MARRRSKTTWIPAPDFVAYTVVARYRRSHQWRNPPRISAARDAFLEWSCLPGSLPERVATQVQVDPDYGTDIETELKKYVRGDGK